MSDERECWVCEQMTPVDDLRKRSDLDICIGCWGDDEPREGGWYRMSWEGTPPMAAEAPGRPREGTDGAGVGLGAIHAPPDAAPDEFSNDTDRASRDAIRDALAILDYDEYETRKIDAIEYLEDVIAVARARLLDALGHYAVTE